MMEKNIYRPKRFNLKMILSPLVLALMMVIIFVAGIGAGTWFQILIAVFFCITLFDVYKRWHVIGKNEIVIHGSVMTIHSYRCQWDHLNRRIEQYDEVKLNELASYGFTTDHEGQSMYCYTERHGGENATEIELLMNDGSRYYFCPAFFDRTQLQKILSEIQLQSGKEPKGRLKAYSDSMN